MSGRFGFPSAAIAAAMALAALGASSAAAQSSILTCSATLNPILVRGEGLTERMGDILLECSGGQPFAGINGNLSVFLSVPMTNRVDATGATDLHLTIDNGSGPQPANTRAYYLNANTQSYSGLAFYLSSTGTVNLRLSNLRGAANQAGIDSDRQITASLSFNAGSLISFSNNVFPVGTVVRSLYSSSTDSLICAQSGSPFIDAPSMSRAFTEHAVYSTVRVTEGFQSSFAPKSDISFQDADFGTRIIVRYTGIPQGVHLYVPVGVVGYDGLQPTSAGDYGLPPSAGAYTPGNGSLLMLLIANADSNGGGVNSSPVVQPPNATTVYDTLKDLTVNQDGTAQAVYEVYDSNNSAVQSATIPSFIYVPPNVVSGLSEINQEVMLAASSSSLATSASSVIPRYVPVDAPNDCTAFGDCNASYFPHLTLSTKSLTFNATTYVPAQPQYFVLSNTGAGNFIWTAQARYTGGDIGTNQWIQLPKSTGINRETVQVNIVPGTLAPGVYDGLIYVDAGSTGGSATIAVTLYLSSQGPTPVVINAVNPANMTPGVLVPGSQAAILGGRLSGNDISVTFNNSPARVLTSVSDQQLNVQIPYNMAGQTSALIVVTIDGSSSTPGLLVPIGDSNPAIFAGQILNQDNSVNTPDNPALAGSTISVYATGLPVAGYFSGRIHDRVIDGDQIVYAGPSPTSIGVQLVQMVVPADLPTLTSGTAVCGGTTQDNQPCSAFSTLSIVGAPVADPTTTAVPYRHKGSPVSMSHGAR
ncbi:MAG TPA: hypothetical protein VGL53_11020 [Bryobacteraceae bacterium]|jgi:uncharacterized protein (TIGR03437 family)